MGPILTEVLLGFRRKNQADWIASRLRLSHYVEAGWSDWRAAADMGRKLAEKGHAIPLTDLLVAAVAKRLEVSIYSTDPDFDVIPEVKRYWPH